MTRPRVLLIAEACNPEMTSVPLVGWSHARALADVADVHVVTQIRNRDAILRAGLVEGRDFTAIDSEAAARPAWRLSMMLRGKGKGWTIGSALSALTYPYFEHLLWKQFGRDIRERKFNIVHRLTPLSPTIPSPVASRCAHHGVPFVLGPLNGGVPWPKGFEHARLNEQEWLSYVRSAYKLVPGYQSTRRNAGAILIASRDTWQQMPRSHWSKCIYIPENAIDPVRFSRRRTREATRPIRLVFIGRLVPYKGADMLIDAIEPLAKAGAVSLSIIGDGPQAPSLREMIEQKGLGHAIKFEGWVPHAQLQERLIDADLMAFPSIREFGGAVALEAMAVGVVPIVVDYGGPGELVTPKTGFLVPIGSRAQIVERFRDLLTHLADHPEEIDVRSGPAWRRAHEQFSWAAKARQVCEVYRWLLEPKPERGRPPHFGMPLPDLNGTA